METDSERAEARAAAAFSRSRSVNDIKLEYGRSTMKMAEAVARPRLGLVTDINVYEGYLEKVKEKGIPKLRSVTEHTVDPGYPLCEDSKMLYPLGPRGWARLIYDRTYPKPVKFE